MSERTPGPIFIGGLFKSGTSLLRAMLGQHSHIAAGLETYWFELDLEHGTARGGEPLDAYLQRMSRYFELDPADVKQLVQQTRDRSEFLDELLGRFARRQGKQRWAEKTPGNVLHLKEIFERFPDARFLHIVRDPRDVFSSYLKSGKRDWPEEFVGLWCQFMGAVEAAQRAQTIDTRNFLELRYEDLVQEPTSTLHRVLDFLEEPWEAAVAAYAGSDRDFDTVLEVTGTRSPTLDRLRSPLLTSQVGVWKTVVAPATVQAIRNAIAGRGFGERYRQLEFAS